MQKTISFRLLITLVIVAAFLLVCHPRDTRPSVLYSDAQVEEQVRLLRTAIKELNEGKTLHDVSGFGALFFIVGNFLSQKDLVRGIAAVRSMHAASRKKSALVHVKNAVQFAHEAQQGLKKIDVAKSVENDILHAKTLLNSFIKKNPIVEQRIANAKQRIISKHALNGSFFFSSLSLVVTSLDIFI